MGYRVFMFVARKPGMSLEAFVDHYENKHVPLVLEILGGEPPQSAILDTTLSRSQPV